MYDSFCIEGLKEKNPYRHKIDAWVSGFKGSGNGEWLLMGTGSLAGDVSVLELDSDEGCTNLWIYSKITELNSFKSWFSWLKAFNQFNVF